MFCGLSSVFALSVADTTHLQLQFVSVHDKILEIF